MYQALFRLLYLNAFNGFPSSSTCGTGHPPAISKLASGIILETLSRLSFWTRDGLVFFLGNHQLVR